MKDEIKEILEILENLKNKCFGEYELKYVDDVISRKDIKLLLDYITNLQEKVGQYKNPDDMTLFYMWLDEKAKDKMKQLQEENNYLKMNNPEQNLEHFRILKENKRKIDNLRKENERLKNELEIMTFTAKIKQDAVDGLISRIDNAIEYINAHKVSDTITFPLMKKEQERDVKNCYEYEFEQIYKKELLNILKGSDK